MGHYGSLKQEKGKLPTSHSLFNVTVLTGLLHGLLFTAFTITRWGHFCGGKNRKISTKTLNHSNEIIWASHSIRGPQRVTFMPVLGKRQRNYWCCVSVWQEGLLRTVNFYDSGLKIQLLCPHFIVIWQPLMYPLFKTGLNSEGWCSCHIKVLF